MTAYIHYNQEHNVLICKVHQCAVSSKVVYRHFLDEHELDLKIRQEVINYASQFTTAEHSELMYEAAKVIPVPYLSIVTAFQCQYDGCAKILGTLYSVKKHCRVDHDWKAKDGNQWIETCAQTFFQGKEKRYLQWKSEGSNIIGTLQSQSQERYQVPVSRIRYWKIYLEQQGGRTRITNEPLIPFKIILHWLRRLRG